MRKFIAVFSLAILIIICSSASAKPLKVYILTGQSNMDGQAEVRTFDHIGMDPKTAPLLEEMRGPDGKPTVCENVWISSLGTFYKKDGECSGKLTAGYGGRKDHSQIGTKIGPEFTFGITMGKAYDGPILIIKTSWGGKSLNTDFRPPSAGPYVWDKEIEQKLRETQPSKLEKKKEATGRYYRLMMEYVKKVLADPSKVCPEYDTNDGYEIAGFVWFQGYNDMVDGKTYPNKTKPGGFGLYSELMAHFIRDVRKDLNAPEMSFVIGVIGVDGKPTEESEAKKPAKSRGIAPNIRKAMAAPADMPEFKGNVAAVHTDQFWDYQLHELDKRMSSTVKNPLKKARKERKLNRKEIAALEEKLTKESFTDEELMIYNTGRSNAAYHYLGSAKIMGQIGKAFAEAMIELQTNNKAQQPKKQIKTYPPTEFGTLQKQIDESKNWNMARLEKETLRKDALIFETDKTPVDIILRRTSALLKHLRSMQNGPNLKKEEKQLNALKSEYKPETSLEELESLFNEIAKLRRKIAFQNPLLDFDKILFLKHDKMVRGAVHMVDQYLGLTQSKQGGLYVLEDPFSDNPQVKSLLENSKVQNGRLKGRILENNGSFISLELDYDAKQIYFAYTEAKSDAYPQGGTEDQLLLAIKNARGNKKHRGTYYAFTPQRHFHIMRVNADGSNLIALTDASHNDFDPCILPNGRIVFISDRIEGNARCGYRYCSTYTLHAMMPDGSDIIPLSYHETNEWHPSVDNNGMIIYSRWDYVDRDSDIAHHLWHCYPDGRDPRSYHGNYPKKREARPWMEMSNRAIPNSRKYVGVSAAHHGQNYGSLVMIDISKKDDGSTSQIKRITPDVHFPESESAPGVMHAKGRHSPKGEVFGQPWPLSEDFYLATYSPTHSKHAIALVDSFGNREILYQDPEIGCLDPIPFRPRKKPPVIPTRTQQAIADRIDSEEKLACGTVTIMNIYASEYPWPKDTKIKELRIVNVFPKPNHDLDDPMIGHADQSLARGILGTVPVEEDGSVHFECPVGMSIYFQALDEKGIMVQNMRSVTYLHTGETLSCIGCHESKQDTYKNNGTPIALRRPPSKIKPESSGSYPLTFPRFVQPVLDAKCVTCHEKQEKAPSLRGDVFVKHGWSEGFTALQIHAWGKSGGNGAIKQNGRSFSIPGKEGFRVSRLYKILVENNHHDVKLTKEELRRISAWVDTNSNFYGAYLETDKQARGEVVQPLIGLPPLIPFENLVR